MLLPHRGVFASLVLALTIPLPFAPPVAAQHCANSSVGLLPLNDLGPRDYLGEEGGLYPDGRNVRPDRHEQVGRAAALEIRPLDANGVPSHNGKIGFVSIGFSSTKLEWDALLTLAQGDPEIAAEVALANCAVPNQDASDIASANSRYWAFDVPFLLASAGLSPQQVEVVWMLEGDRYIHPSFPADAQALEGYLEQDLAALEQVLPNVKIVYLSSHTYVGYSADPAVFEPIAYDESFAVKWLIERQILGDPSLNADSTLGEIKAPWLAWGPLLWTDGVRPRSDGFTWECNDVRPDGAHPSPRGSAKVARLLLHQWKSDPTATPWFRADRGKGLGAPAFVELFGDGTNGTFGEPLISVSELPTVPTPHPLHLGVDLACPNASGAFALGVVANRDGGVPFHGGELHVGPLAWLPFTTDPTGHGSFEFGDVPNDPKLVGLDLFAQAAIPDPLGPTGEELTRAIEFRLGE
jgi:hypothetical protein